MKILIKKILKEQFYPDDDRSYLDKFDTAYKNFNDPKFLKHLLHELDNSIVIEKFQVHVLFLINLPVQSCMDLRFETPRKINKTETSISALGTDKANATTTQVAKRLHGAIATLNN